MIRRLYLQELLNFLEFFNMITTIKNDTGFIAAYIEWSIVDEKEHEDKDGKYLFVHDTWVHKDYRNAGFLSEMIAKIWDASPDGKYEFVYYYRDKHSGKRSKIFLASKFLKHTRHKIKFSEVK